MKRILYLIILTLLPICTFAQTTMDVLQRMHQAKKGETIESVALHYGISPQALRNANPDIKKNKLKKGQYLCIPAPMKTEATETATQNAKQVLTQYKNLRVGVVLPLTEKTDRGHKFVEFYQGLLMAAETIKKEGINIDIYAWNSGTSEAQIRELMGKMEGADLQVVFGPADALQIAPLRDFCAQHNIRIVLPFSNNLANNTYAKLYTATSSNAIVMNEAASLIASQYANRNYIIVNSGEEDAKGKAFVQHLTQQLGKKGVTPRQLNLHGDEFAYDMAFNQFRQNCVVIDNANVKTLNILLAKLNEFKLKHPDFQVCLQGYPEWQTYTGTLLNDFFTYDTYIYSTYYYNPLSEKTEDFQKRFFKNFGKEMLLSYPRYGMMGYDMGYYFMHGMAMLGDTFENLLPSIPQDAYQHMYRFTGSAEDGSGYTNSFIQLIHFTPKKTIELIR